MTICKCPKTEATALAKRLGCKVFEGRPVPGVITIRYPDGDDRGCPTTAPRWPGVRLALQVYADSRGIDLSTPATEGRPQQ